MTLTPRQRLLSLAAVIAASFGVGVAFGVGFPLTALTLESWHEPKWMIGLAGSAPAIAVLIALPALPAIVGRTGPAFAIASGCALSAAGFLCLYLFQNAWAWLVIRLAMSAGLALPWLAGETWINTVTREEMRGRVIALYAIAFFAGFATGPYLLDILGLVGPLPFLAGALGTAIAGVPIMLARKLAPDLTQEGSLSVFAALRLAPFGMLGAFIGGFAEIGYLSLIPNVGLAAGLEQDTALKLLSITTIGGIVLQYPIGWLTDKVSRVRVMLVLAVAFLILTLALPWALNAPASAFVVAFILGGVLLGFYTLGLAIVGEQVTSKDLAAANAAFLIMYQIGAIAGPFTAGIAMGHAPVVGFVATVAAFMTISIALLAWMSRRAHDAAVARRVSSAEVQDTEVS